jgi:hypothetical protein
MNRLHVYAHAARTAEVRVAGLRLSILRMEKMRFYT